MRVVLPYFPGKLHPRVLPAIERQGYEPALLCCVNRVGHPSSYPNILRTELLADRDVCIVEHDVESRPGFLDDLRDCPEPWCFFAYDFRTSYEEAVGDLAGFASLGHTRFKAGFAEPLRELLDSPIFQSTWVARDSFICEALHNAGFTAHRHPGKAIHHHEYHPVP